MLNNYDVYVAFNQCKKIYGVTEVHVQLIAKQLGVLAGEVIDVIDANSSLYSTRMNPANSNYTSNVSGSEYAGMIVTGITTIPYLSTSSVIREADNGGTIVLTPSTSTFKNSTSTDNWIVDVGLTGLTLASVNNQTATKTLTFTGTAHPGTISIKCKSTGITSGVASDTIYIDIAALRVDYSAISNIAAGVTAIEGDVETLQGEVFPTITVVDTSTADGNNYDVLETDVHIVVEKTSVNNRDTVTLMAASGSGKKIIITNADDTSDVVITPDGNDTIFSDATHVLGEESSVVLVDAIEGMWVTI